VVGTVCALEGLGIEELYLSPFHVGNGVLRCAHGLMPLPAPATARLIQGWPVVNRGIQGELTTPTGAAILTALGQRCNVMPSMTLSATGYGCGDREFEIPNFIRVMIGESQGNLQAAPGKAGSAGLRGREKMEKDLLYGQGIWQEDEVAVIEANIDDMSPQDFDPLFTRLFELGALEVNVMALTAKKGRPGHLLTVLAPPSLVATAMEEIFNSSTTIGIRYNVQRRAKLPRRIKVVETSFGRVAVKMVKLPSGDERIFLEYEDLLAISRSSGTSMIDLRISIMQEVLRTLSSRI
jgi:hypothetical protein